MSGRFHLRVFGCQMNQHDAEKIQNLLHHQGFRPAEREQDADLLLVHTCSVREKAEQKLYSELGRYAALKRSRAGLVIGVGGCVAQQEGGDLLARFPQLDFVFGPQNIVHLPELIASARRRHRALATDYDGDPQARFDLPERHPEYSPSTPGRAFVTVMEGCDLFCAFCVVPRTRGREVSRSSRAILDEVRQRADEGVVEVTLLGQTVNAYGRPRPGRARGEIPFAELVRRVAAVPGIERVRFTSPHPIFAGPDLVACFAEVPALCPHIHLPVQSGSTEVLRAMGRRHTREDYLETVARLRSARPDIAITTDLIVGFPGESAQDFEQTLSLVETVGFVDHFSFKYSPRPGTPALRRTLPPVPPEEAQERLETLQALQRTLTLRAHRRRVGTRTPVLVEGPSRRSGGAGSQLQGRCPWNRVVNFSGCLADAPPGRILWVDIVGAGPHSLIGAPAGAAPRELQIA